MKKQSKILLVIFAILVVGVATLVSTNSSLFQGRMLRNNAITRAEFAQLLAVNAGMEKTTPCNAFSDVPESAPFYGNVCSLYNNGIIQPYADGTFKPFKSLNRAEASKMISTAFKVSDTSLGTMPQFFPDVKYGMLYFSDINLLAFKGFFIKETPINSKFKPDDVLTVSAANRWFSQSDKL